MAFLYLISNILTSDVPSKEINPPVALGETTEHVSSVVVQPFGGGFGGLGVGPFGGFPFGGFGRFSLIHSRLVQKYVECDFSLVLLVTTILTFSIVFI
jgi:hypothetical protein